MAYKLYISELQIFKNVILKIRDGKILHGKRNNLTQVQYSLHIYQECINRKFSMHFELQFGLNSIICQ